MLHTGKLRNMASLYLRKGDAFLLLFRQGSSIVSNLWIGSAGGHFEQPELNDAKACVLRELYEELSITEDQLANFSLRYVTLRYTGEEPRQNYYFFADLAADVQGTPASNEGITQWFPMNELQNLPMPFTARHMIDHYISTGRFDDLLYGGIASGDSIMFQKL